jgi:hypothetical protein
MASVSESIAREYFELLGFMVSQPCKYVTPGQSKKVEQELDLLIAYPRVR